MDLPSRWLREGARRRIWPMLPVALLVLLLAYRQGRYPSTRFMVLLIVLGAGALLLQHPVLGLPALVLAALVVRMEFGTGTMVALNPATLLLPVLWVLWLLDRLHRRELHVASSRTNKPLFLFLLCGLLSLGVGTAFWDPLVPRPGNILLVQLAQWAVFALSAGAFWLPANLHMGERAMRRLVLFTLVVGGMVVLLWVVPGTSAIRGRLTTGAVGNSPIWFLLTALACGQLLYNRELGTGWRVFLLAILAAVLYYVFEPQQELVTFWLGVAAALGVLFWLRFPRLHWPILILVVMLLATGILFSAVWEYAGGEKEWTLSGGSRIVLSKRVIEVTLRNPITGLGPAAYRAYAGRQPLVYGGAFWTHPQANSHNNYVDLFGHVGLLGLGLFLWFMVEVALLAWRLRARYRTGFAAGYINGMLATWVSVMVVMVLIDCFLPHVYNVGFVGFQASVLVWMFLGGLVAIDRLPQESDDTGGLHAA